jgi:hypothetical protein
MGLREFVRQVEHDGCLLENHRCAVLQERDFAVRMRIGGIERARPIDAADRDILDDIGLPDLLKESKESVTSASAARGRV